jgi:hypothetical protein
MCADGIVVNSADIVPEKPEYETIDTVTCMGCLEQMTPNQTDWELFRIGIHVHDSDSCFEKAEYAFSKNN